jgi:hypothetical protein
MKTCERGEALVELADKFACALKELTEEIKYLEQRIVLLENPNRITIDIDKSIHKLQEEVDDIECGMGHK